ncbi:transporter [Longimonas halophila]|uniref:Transporter n=1 Tax=Longimonas halophila TaxID=1469170 RepID=A0A2H3P205_9BACT|nr:transporter [Longimonas halophila]
MRRLLLPFCILILLVHLTPVGAQAQSDETITFDEAVTIALDQNTDLQRAINDVQRQDATIRQRQFDFGPNLNLSTSTTRQFGRSFSQEEGAIVNQTTDIFRVNANSSITVFDGFNNIASLREANRQGEASELNLERTRQDVVFTVMEQYIALSQSKQEVEVRRGEVEFQEQQLEQIQEFVDAGARPTSDLFQAEADLAQAEQQLLQAQREVEVNNTRLIQTLQLDPFGTYTFEAPDVDPAALEMREYAISEMLDNAFDRRVDLRAQEANVRASEAGVRIAQSNYWPSLSVNMGYGSNWSSTVGALPGNTDPSFFDVLDSRRGGNIGFSLSFPIFDRLQRRTQTAQARANVREAEYALQDRRQTVALQVRQAILDYRNAQKQLEAAESRLESARRLRNAAQERYNLGSASIVELSQATRDFTDAASAKVQAEFDVAFQQKRIAYQMGTLSPDAPLAE